MTQHEFDEAPGITVHLLVDDSHPPRALCSGLPIDPDRWRDDTKTVRKQCQACFLAARRKAVVKEVETHPPGSAERAAAAAEANCLGKLVVELAEAE